MIRYFFSLLLIGVLFVGCKNETPPSTPVAEEQVTAETETQDWIMLFDGTSLDGWRGYNAETLPPGWIIENGELTFSTEKQTDAEYEGGKDIIYAAEEFENFELYVEWKIPPGGNSGIMYHVKEGYSGPFEAAPEYQMIDDENYAKLHDLVAYNTSLGYDEPAKLQPLQQTGADYAMYPADDANKVLYPAGMWNSSRIKFTPEKVEYYLNEKKIVEFVPWSDDWNERKNNGKWAAYPDYGKFKKGYIGLQDHDSPLWFRNIKIRKL